MLTATHDARQQHLASPPTSLQGVSIPYAHALLLPTSATSARSHVSVPRGGSGHTAAVGDAPRHLGVFLWRGTRWGSEWGACMLPLWTSGLWPPPHPDRGPAARASPGFPGLDVEI